MPLPNTPRGNLFNMKNQGTSNVSTQPAPPQYTPQAYTPPPPSGPNPGDFNASGDRWDPVSGQWLNPGFFSDLSGGGGGGVAPSPAPIGGAAPPPPPGVMPGGPLVQPQNPATPGGYPGIEIPEQLVDYIPENLRAAFASQMSPFLSQYGFRGLGNIGRYGERSYGRAGGQGPIGFTPEMFNFFSDPAMRNWYQWLFGERGLTAQRTPYPQ